jgi:uncharacterized membrane protein YhaH (DUF805 family)
MNWNKLLFTAQGRIGRKSYWIFMGLSFAVGLVAMAIDSAAFSNFEDGPIGRVVNLASIFPSICIQTKRLHDFGRSGWLQLAPVVSLAPAVPIIIVGGQVGAIFGVGIIVLAFGALFIWSAFFKGQPGPNTYGEPNSGDRDVTPVVEVFS